MSLNEILIDELRDLYSAENQLVKALPKVVRGISNPEMKQMVKDHLEETKNQVLRLREVFGHIGKKPTGKHCSGMEGCIKEVQEALEEDYEGALMDASITGASLRVEHYEIAGYTVAIAIAKALGEKDIVALLTETLNEETKAAKNVVAGSKPVLKEALTQEDPEEDEEHEEEEEKDPKEQESEQKSEEDEQEAAGDVQGGTAPKKAAKKA
jgi:ferritin-like metal-binding protein YciE